MSVSALVAGLKRLRESHLYLLKQQQVLRH
jgi:hypothetical protein